MRLGLIEAPVNMWLNLREPPVTTEPATWVWARFAAAPAPLALAPLLAREQPAQLNSEGRLLTTDYLLTAYRR